MDLCDPLTHLVYLDSCTDGAIVIGMSVCLSGEILLHRGFDSFFSHLVYLTIVLDESLWLSLCPLICLSICVLFDPFGCYGPFGLFYFCTEWIYVIIGLNCLSVLTCLVAMAIWSVLYQY